MLTGLSPTVLLVAEQRLLDYKENPDVVFGALSDDEMEGVELIKALPLSKIKLSCQKRHKLVVVAHHKPTLYFELCNTRLSPKLLGTVWKEWVWIMY